MATPEMLAAVSAAVKGEDAPAAPDTPPSDTPEDTPPADAAPPAAATGDDLIGAPPGDAPPADAAPADAGPARGPDGKFLPKTTAAEPPKAEAPAAAAQPKVADPVNDPIPENVKPATRERITTLVETVKAKDTELTATRADLDLIMAPIQEAGATVEQFREAMQLVKLLNSPHAHEQQQALQMLQGAGAALAERLGQVPPGADPLAGQDDLLQAVNAGQMPRPYAEEVARARRLSAATAQQSQVAAQRVQQQTAQQQAIQAGQDAVRTVEQTLEATDPHYKAKIAALRADTAFVAQLRALPPTQWAVKFAERYRAIPAPAAPAGTAAAPGAPTPLRAKTPAGTAAKPPGSMLEAVTSALRAG